MRNENHSDKVSTKQDLIFLLIPQLKVELVFVACVAFILLRRRRSECTRRALLTCETEGTTMQPTSIEVPVGELTTLLPTHEATPRKAFFLSGIFGFFTRGTLAKTEEDKKTAEQKALIKDIEDFTAESAQIAADLKLLNDLTHRSIDELRAQARELKATLGELRMRVGESVPMSTVGERKSVKPSEYKLLQSGMLELMGIGQKYHALGIPGSFTGLTLNKIKEVREKIKDQSRARREIHRQLIAVATQLLDMNDIAIRDRRAQGSYVHAIPE